MWICLDQLTISDNTASTLIGQCMEALNNQTQIDDFNIENFHGGLECNLEEVSTKYYSNSMNHKDGHFLVTGLFCSFFNKNWTMMVS